MLVDPPSPAALLRAAVDELRSLQLTAVADDETLDLLRDIEVEVRRLTAVDHALLSEIDRRSLAGKHGFRDTTALVSGVLRVDGTEAARRVHAARDLGPRISLTGEVLPPLYPDVAAACGDGKISASHARVVVETIEALPSAVRARQGDDVAALLTGHAHDFAPRELRKLARRLREQLDPDGRLTDDADRARRRELRVVRHVDGTVSGSFTTDAVCGEALLTYLDTAARPIRDGSGSRDERTSGQRRHDALRDLLLTALRSDLPASGGVSTTIVLTMSPEQLVRDPGADRLVTTGHGSLIDLDTAHTLTGDARVFPVLLGRLKRVEAYGTAHRLYTEGQRLTLVARDGGCTFPGCSISAAWCEANHVVPFSEGGPTSVSNGILLCGYHHRYFEQLGWSCVMNDGVPEWIPPSWVDPERRPRRNVMHDPARALDPWIDRS